jgi:hypothetical protein
MKAKIALGVELNQPVVRVVPGHGGKILTTKAQGRRGAGARRETDRLKAVRR